MKIYYEHYLHDFNFWSGAKDNIKYLTKDDLKKRRTEVQ